MRDTLFDKTAGPNWLVPFHQDLTIEVKERRDVDGFGPWTEKAGAICVQPPTWIMEAMVSIRLHLDDCDASNGALRVMRGSHRMGRLKPGDGLILPPLLLHASSRATTAAHRRVIHIDFTSVDLPGGLEWRQAI